MNLLEILLLFCGFFSALIVSGVSSQDVTISVEPNKPSLSGPIFINCTTDVASKKIQSFSIYRGKEEILTFDPASRPRVQWSDESLKQHFTFYKALKKQTILSLEVKNPLCTDQNVYKCVLVVKNKEPKEDQKRVDFYVPGQNPKDVTLMIKGTPQVGEELELNCTGKITTVPGHSIVIYKRTKMNSDFTKLMAGVIDEKSVELDDCMIMVTKLFSYKPTQEDKGLELMCRITADDGKSSDAMQVIDVQGITPDHVPDDDNDDMDKTDEMDNGDKNTDMPDEATVVPEPKPEGKDDGEEPTSEGKPKEETVDKVIAKKDKTVSENSSGMLREYCLLVFATALLVMV
ncbi:uncharacterized protein LOC106871899 isoform X2 [Octopus bimaculoides]|uniref:uncharacterized protein LOC106871899 isoform X2 n=1 Tax=Octopus bimaculoides TaxID=37653 RepID=UPI00071CB54D|nr:uncharacterized protein LOC106871899 isoform X2 [Octopus bimaculoides]|eukprot:XP_014774140.1 PREDICTED: uncharacterized protein LOC106871899 isoform X2 [Octopus bimaculoides]